MAQKKIELYKTRDFGAKINATIEYIRQNFGPLIKIVLLIVAPVGLLASIIFSNFFATMMSFSANPEAMNEDPVAFLSVMGTNYLLLMLVALLTYSFMYSSIYSYIKMRNEREEKPEVLEVLRVAIGKVPGVIALMILVGIVSVFGMVFFIIPGVFLAITLSLSVPIYLFEEKGIGDAFGKSFKLIKGKWWSTLGIIFVSSLIASMVSYVFIIPMYVMMVGQMFSHVNEGGDPEAVFEIFSSWYTSAAMAFAMIGSYLTYLIPITALAFQYFNLSERIEGTGIRNQIEGFESLN